MTDGTAVNVEGFKGLPNYRTTKAIGYLVRVWGSRWIACVGKRRSEPLSLLKAKAAAKRMDREQAFGNEVSDRVRNLNKQAAWLIDEEALLPQRQEWPLDLMGGGRRQSGKTIAAYKAGTADGILDAEMGFVAEALQQLQAEPLQGDNYPLTYDANGCPELPDCLDRRSPTKRAA